jgi:hypothetical protein
VFELRRSLGFGLRLLLLVGLVPRLASPAGCQSAADCDNGLFCDGAEVCDPVAGCRPGVPPPLDDGEPCTIDECDELNDLVVHRAGPFGVPDPQLPPDQVGQWGSVNSWPSQATHMTVLHTGKVLWWRGGATPAIRPTYVWDPQTEESTPIVPPVGHMLCMGHATLADGRVLAVGGYAPPADPPHAMIFDPLQETWTRVADMAYGRYYPSATTLGNGEVIVMSGRRTPTELSTIPERYDPLSGEWTSLPQAEIVQPLYPNNFLLPDGRVLYANRTSAVLDLGTLRWQAVPPGAASAGFGSTSAMLDPGVVLRTGHGDGVSELLDMNTRPAAWQRVASMKYRRLLHNIVLLPDGNALAVGGSLAFDHHADCAVNEAELWDVPAQVWRPMASAERTHAYHSAAVLLPDGRVLVGGGENQDLPQGEDNTEIYSPPYLFRGPRPQISALPASARLGETIPIETPQAGAITEVALMRPGSTTHAFDENQRRVAADFEAEGSSLSVTLTADPDVLPPGFYMLFLIDLAGVPSIGRFLQVHGDRDSDGVHDDQDNCVVDANTDQANADSDELGDACDRCPAYAAATNADSDGNGIGDACECGDQTQDGAVDVADIVAIHSVIFGSVPISPLCDTNNDQKCNVSDMVGVHRKIFGRAAYCSRYPPPTP